MVFAPLFKGGLHTALYDFGDTSLGNNFQVSGHHGECEKNNFFSHYCYSSAILASSALGLDYFWSVSKLCVFFLFSREALIPFASQHFQDSHPFFLLIVFQVIRESAFLLKSW